MEVNNAMALTKPIHSGTGRHLPAVLATAMIMTLVVPGAAAPRGTGRLPSRRSRGPSVIFISGGKVEASQLSRGDVVFIHAGRVTTLSRSSGAPLRLVGSRPKQAEPAYDPHPDRRPSEAPGRDNITILSPGRRAAPASRIRLFRQGTKVETPAAGRGQSSGTASALVCAFGAEFQP